VSGNASVLVADHPPPLGFLMDLLDGNKLIIIVFRDVLRMVPTIHTQYLRPKNRPKCAPDKCNMKLWVNLQQKSAKDLAYMIPIVRAYGSIPIILAIIIPAELLSDAARC